MKQPLKLQPDLYPKVKLRKRLGAFVLSHGGGKETSFVDNRSTSEKGFEQAVTKELNFCKNKKQYMISAVKGYFKAVFESDGILYRVFEFGIHRALIVEETSKGSKHYEQLLLTAREAYKSGYHPFGRKTKNNCVSAISKVLSVVFPNEIKTKIIVPNKLDKQLKKLDFKRRKLNSEDFNFKFSARFDPEFKGKKQSCSRRINTFFNTSQSTVSTSIREDWIARIEGASSVEQLKSILEKISEYADRNMLKTKHTHGLFKKSKEIDKSGYQMLQEITKELLTQCPSSIDSSQLNGQNDDDRETYTIALK